MIKRRFWFGCPHKFSFPIKSPDGIYYQVCTGCGAEYGYDWKRMKRTKPLVRRIQQTSLDACRPEASQPAAAGQQAPQPRVVMVGANVAGGWAERARRWDFSRRRIRLASVIALVALLAFTYVVVHRSGRALRDKKRREIAAAQAQNAVHSEPSITVVASDAAKAAPTAAPTLSQTSHQGGAKKLKPASGAQRVQTPVLAVSEAMVSSQPEGAQVRFDGSSEPVFVTPAVVGSIPPGHHSVVFSKPGYVSQTVTLDVVAGIRSTVSARLVLKGSVLSISSNPAGAAIFLDGKSTALTSPTELRVDVSGTHTITLVQSGFLAAQSQVNVRDGENSSVAFTLIPAGNAANSKVVGGIKRLLPSGSAKEMAEVQFKTNPKGARLMLNGWSAPKATPLELRLPPGGYDVVIQADGFKRFSKEIVVEAGQKVVLQEALERSTQEGREAKP